MELFRWRRRLVDGGVLFVHPGDPEAGVVRVIDRAGELSVADALTAATDRFVGCKLESRETFDTHEGEVAFLVRLSGLVETRAVQESLGFVLTERCHREIRAVVAGAENFDGTHALVRRLLETSILGLGELRRRRYRHDRPAGWRHVGRGLISEWYAADADATIWVLPAKPRHEDAVCAAVESAFGEPTLSALVYEERPHTCRVRSRHGLQGRLVTVEAAFPGRPRARWTHVAFEDARFHYACVLEDRSPIDHRATFEAVWSSVAPVAAPRRADTSSSPHNHWMD